MTKVYSKGTFEWKEKEGVNLSVNDLIKRYEDGYAGCYLDTEEYDKFSDLSKETGGYTYVEDAATAFGWADAFAGQLVVPFVHVMENFPGAWPGPAQGRGDCFVAGTLVRMADGSLKKIEEVKIGDSVLSHTNTPRLVTDTIKKSYSGQILKIHVEKLPYTLECTPDHRIETFIKWDSNGKNKSSKTELKRAEKLSIGDRLSVGYGLQNDIDEINQMDLSSIDGLYIDEDCENLVRSCKKSKPIKRYIDIDEDFCWLIGMYLAEGGIEYKNNDVCSQVRFSLSSDESNIAKKICEIINSKFGITCNFYIPNYKKSIIRLDICSKTLAILFKCLIPGNIYSKQVPDFMNTESRSNKIALLRGWFDGDGYCKIKIYNNKYDTRVVGTSVSEELAIGMYNISLSCNLNTGFRVEKKSEHQTHRAKRVTIYGEDVLAIYPEKISEFKNYKFYKRKNKKDNSFALKIKNIENYETKNIYVYCLEVEHDHMFQANFINVSNCVSHSGKNAILGTMVGDVVSKTADEVSGNLEDFPKISIEGIRNGGFSTEAAYWYRGHSGDGWFCGAHASIAMTKSGGVIRKNYPEIGIDLTRYSASLAGKWGRSAPPKEITDAMDNNLIRTAARASSFEASRDALGQGRFLSTCGGEGFSKTRDANGISSRSGRWAHAMAEIGADDREEIKRMYGEPLVLVLNSWGVWNKGPRDIYNSSQYVPKEKEELWEKLDIVNPQTGNIMIPKGSFWCKWSDWKNRERIVYAGFNGWKMQKIDNWGLNSWG